MTIVGTPKQVAWANGIRTTQLAKWVHRMAVWAEMKLDSLDNRRWQWLMDWMFLNRTYWEEEIDASAIIENRDDADLLRSAWYFETGFHKRIHQQASELAARRGQHAGDGYPLWDDEAFHRQIAILDGSVDPHPSRG